MKAAPALATAATQPLPTGIAALAVETTGTNSQGQTLKTISFGATVDESSSESGLEYGYDLVPVDGETVYFSVEAQDGIWWPVCNAVTNNSGVATCSGDAPSLILYGTLTYDTLSAWSAVVNPTLAGDQPGFAAASDYSAIPGAPTPAATPPDNGGITIIPQTYVSGCTPPDPSAYGDLGTLMTDGGNCQLESIESIITTVTLGVVTTIITGGLSGVDDVLQAVNWTKQALNLAEQAIDLVDAATAQEIELGNAALVKAGQAATIFRNAATAFATATPSLAVATGAYLATVASTTVMAEFGTVTNEGSHTIAIAADAPLEIGDGTTFQNDGTIDNSGTFTSADSSNQGTGTVDNEGTIINNGTIPGDGQGTDGGVLITGNNFTLDFDDNDGPGTAPDPLHVYAPTVADSEQSLPTPQSSPGQGFAGWFTSASGGTQVTGTTDLTSLLATGPSSLTLYAQFQPLPAASSPTIANLANDPVTGGSFVAQVSTDGDGTASVSSSTPTICKVQSDGLTVDFLAQGTCELTAAVGDGSQYAAATGAQQSLTVGQPTPTVNFLSSTNGIRPGVPVSVLLGITGNYQTGTPTGQVQFYLCGPLKNGGGCSSGDDGVPVSVKADTGDEATAQSPTVTPTQDGTYCFGAAYTGDSNYLSEADTGSDGCFVVGSDSTNTTVTCPSGAVTVGDSGSCSTTVTDTSGAPVTVTGTVTYSLYTGTDCVKDASNNLVSSTTVDLRSDGTLPDYTSSASLSLGAYNVAATYNGDSEHGTSSGCDKLLVGQLTPDVASALPQTAGDWTTGTQATVSFSVGDQYPGGSVPEPTGSLTDTLYGSGDCTGTPVATQGPYANGTPESDPSPPLAAGSYSYAVSYAGDDAYSSGTAPCLPFTVGVATTSLQGGMLYPPDDSVAGVTGYNLGTMLTFTALLDGGVSGFSGGGNLTFTEYDDTDCVGQAADTQTVAATLEALNFAGPSKSLPPGFYSYAVAYSGDGNYAPSQSACASFTVDQGTAVPVVSVTDADTGGAWAGTETSGASAEAHVSLGSNATLTPSGQVTYTLWSGSQTCTGQSTSQTVTVNPDGSVPSVNSGQLPQGTYSYQASYGGDVDYVPVSSSNCVSFSVGYAPLEITEARLTAPASDFGSVYVELYNPSSLPVNLAGWSVQKQTPSDVSDADQGIESVSLPSSVTIPAGGHYLLANSDPHLLSGLTLPEGVTADQDLFALQLNSDPDDLDGVQVQAPDGTITDSVGYAGTAFAEGTGLTPLSSSDADTFTAFVRRFSAGQPVDTGDNAADFQLVAPDAATADYGQTVVLGTPAPSNSASPRQVNEIAQSYLLDPSVGESATPNLTYTPPASGAGTESATNPGVLTIRRTVTNVSADETITRLRLRVTGLSTYGEQSDPTYGDPGDPSRVALLADTSTPADPVNSTAATTLDNYESSFAAVAMPSTGLNSTLTIDLPTQTGGSAPGLIPGQSVNIAVSFYVYRPGQFAFAYNLEDDLKRYTTSSGTGTATSVSSPTTGSGATQPAAVPTGVSGAITATGVKVTGTAHAKAVKKKKAGRKKPRKKKAGRKKAGKKKAGKKKAGKKKRRVATKKAGRRNSRRAKVGQLSAATLSAPFWPYRSSHHGARA